MSISLELTFHKLIFFGENNFVSLLLGTLELMMRSESKSFL